MDATMNAARFSTANPIGTPVIVITPENSKRLTCGSIVTSMAWSDGHKTWAWCQGFRCPQRLDRISPVRMAESLSRLSFAKLRHER